MRGGRGRLFAQAPQRIDRRERLKRSRSRSLSNERRRSLSEERKRSNRVGRRDRSLSNSRSDSLTLSVTRFNEVVAKPRVPEHIQNMISDIRKKFKKDKPSVARTDFKHSNLTNAIRRLQRDYKDLKSQANDLVGVVAEPLSDDMFVWHGNIVGTQVWEGAIFHFEMLIP